MDTNVKPLDNVAGTRILKLALLGGALAMLCLFFLLMFAWFQPDQLSLSDRYFPSPTATRTRPPTSTPTASATPSQTSTPTHTATPAPTLTPTRTATRAPTLTLTPTPTHPLSAVPEGATVQEESFDSDSHNWKSYYSNNTVRVDDGKLFLQSNEVGSMGIASCLGCVYDQILYLQAELMLEKNAPIEHGLAYCSASTDDAFYVFRINQTYSTFRLSKQEANEWDPLIAATRTNAIRKYPASNTLGVYFDQGRSDLYINDILVGSYMDSVPLQCSWAGVLISNGTLNLMADNIYTYTAKPVVASPTSTP